MQIWRCAYCADVIGMYEPVVIVVDDESRLTSRAAEPDLPDDGAQFHRDCHEKLRRARHAA